MDYKEKVIALLNSQELSKEQKEKLEEIFPELAESEDERVRKGAITSIRRFIEYTEEEDCAPDIKDMLITNAEKQIAWLEKQEKPKHSFLQDAFDKSRKYTLDDKIEASEYSESILPTSIADGESEEEYKLHTIMEAAFIAGQRKLKPTYYGNSIYCRISEQKPAWSEEDESILQGIWDEILANKHDAKEYEWKTYDKFLNWLKSLKDRVLPKSADWNEEDEANLNNIIWLCNNCINGSETTWIPSQATKIKHLIETIKERGLPQQKATEWSEDDDEKFRDVIRLVEQGAPVQSIRDHYTNWLKSLKQRIGE